MESHEKFKARLLAEGGTRWKDFVHRRESMKANGVVPRDAWTVAMQEFPPLCDEPATIMADYAKRLAEEAAKASDVFDAAPPAEDGECETASATSADQVVIQQPASPDGLANSERQFGGKRKPRTHQKPPVSPVVSGSITPSATQTTPPPRLVPSTSTTAKLTLAMFDGKAGKVDMLDWLQFVANYIDVEDVKPEMAPAPGAWSWLHRIRTSPLMAQDFYRLVLPKLLPNKTQLENENRRKDDGRTHFEFIDKLLQEAQEPAAESEIPVLPSGSEEPGSESPIPA